MSPRDAPAAGPLRGIFTSDAAARYLYREPQLEISQLTERVWTISDGRARAMFAEGSSSIIAFDTLSTPAAAAAFRDAVASVVPAKEIGTIVYTHDHLDATGWGDVLAPGVEVIAHEATAELISWRRADGQSSATRRVRGDGELLDLDGVQVSLHYPGPTHGTGNLAVLLPEARTMFTAGTVLSNARYGFFPDCHLGQLTISLRSLLGLDFEVVVPGRYDVMDRSAFVEGIDYIEALDEACQHAYLDPEVFIWVMDMVGGYVADRLRPQFGHLDGFDTQLRFGAFRMIHHYLMGGWGLEDTAAGGWALYEPAVAAPDR